MRRQRPTDVDPEYHTYQQQMFQTFEDLVGYPMPLLDEMSPVGNLARRDILRWYGPMKDLDEERWDAMVEEALDITGAEAPGAWRFFRKVLKRLLSEPPKTAAEGWTPDPRFEHLRQDLFPRAGVIEGEVVP